MERATSAASSAAAPSTASLLQHKRTASKGGTRTLSPTVISLFVTNLRLLDLDLLPDWPTISAASFSDQDARIRIRCTEWALYQLFRLYDPTTTADKLQPFFPPLEPLQSINLRAALYRCLNELKKNGVLGRETVLRKTMLDECQGDKFWEVCLAFSATVLRKATLGSRPRQSRPVAQKLGVAQSVSKPQRDSLLPLAVAHKASLSRVLAEKQRKRETYARLFDVLAEKEAELAQRKQQAQERAKARKDSVQLRKLAAVESSVSKAWAGSYDLRIALVHGDVCAAGDAIITTSPEELLRDTSLAGSTGTDEPPDGLLNSIEHAARAQNLRMRRWQSMHERMVVTKPAPTTVKDAQVDQIKPKLRFDRHRSLTVGSTQRSASAQPPPPRQKHASVSRYDEILTAMREDLRKAAKTRSATAPTPMMPPRKLSITLDAVAGATSQRVPQHQRSPLQRSPSSASSQSAPIRPGLGRRLSSRSKSYHQPKVISQREPIPLKSELFSPLKGQRRPSSSPSSATSLLASPQEEYPQSTSIDGAISEQDSQRHGHISNVSVAPDSGVGLGIAASVSPSETTTHSPRSTRATSDETEDIIAEAGAFKRPLLPVSKPSSSDSPSRPSLAERTRQSLAFRSNEDSSAFLPEPSPTELSIEEEEPTLSAPAAGPDFDRRASLLDRTRQSILAAPREQPKPKKTALDRNRSSIYPVNQFDTPKKTGRSSAGLEPGTDNRRDITPREKLFEADAEYHSVFKPRPKIALSPVVSPFAGIESINGNGGLEEMSRSSPLVDVDRRHR